MLGTAAPAAGLRAAAALAADVAVRPPPAMATVAAAAARLAGVITAAFGRTGYSAIRWPPVPTRPHVPLVPPFAEPGPQALGGRPVSAAGPHRPQRRPGSRRGVVR